MKHAINRAVLGALPKRTLTTWVGRLSRHPVSRHAIPWYIRHYQIDVSEAELPVGQYTSLVDFFRRRLKSDARRVSTTGVVSPVDGTVSELGRIEDGKLLQIKGVHYSLASLLGGTVEAGRYLGGDYITLYLSPRDYHRIHMPTDGRLVRWTYIPGKLYPVNRLGVHHVRGLFTKNERLITHVESEFGNYAVVKVGATIVGSIRTAYGPKYAAPRVRAHAACCSEDVSIQKRRGEEMGWFEFGSTVILVFEPGVIRSITAQTGDFVRMGQTVALPARALP